MADRLFRIEACGQCDHRRKLNIGGLPVGYCGKDEERRNIFWDNAPPDWCPLPLANTATLANTAKGGK